MVTTLALKISFAAVSFAHQWLRIVNNLFLFSLLSHLYNSACTLSGPGCLLFLSCLGVWLSSSVVKGVMSVSTLFPTGVFGTLPLSGFGFHCLFCR